MLAFFIEGFGKLLSFQTEHGKFVSEVFGRPSEDIALAVVVAGTGHIKSVLFELLQ